MCQDQFLPQTKKSVRYSSGRSDATCYRFSITLVDIWLVSPLGCLPKLVKPRGR